MLSEEGSAAVFAESLLCQIRPSPPGSVLCPCLKESGCTQDDDVQFSQDSAVSCCVLHFPSVHSGNDLLCLVVKWPGKETVTPQSLVPPPVAHSSCAVDQICSHLASVEPVAQAEM